LIDEIGSYMPLFCRLTCPADDVSVQHKKENNPSIISVQLASKPRGCLGNVTKAPRADAEAELPVSGVADLDRLPYTPRRAVYQPNCSTEEQSSIEQFALRSTVHHRHTVRHQTGKPERHGSSANREQNLAAQNQLLAQKWFF
jgi:hypothetical protein